MTLSIKDLSKLAKQISEDAKKQDHYDTGMTDEHIIAAAYNTMDLERLVKIRFIMNKLIERKKEELAKKIGHERYKELMARWCQYD